MAGVDGAAAIILGKAFLPVIDGILMRLGIPQSK
jgi:hypothetical protein